MTAKLFAWMSQHLAGQCARMLAFFDRRLAVHEYITHAGGILMRLIVGGLIAIFLGVEDHKVRIVSRFEVPTLRQFEDIGRQTAAAANRVVPG